jgi:hypothetical protein
LRVSNSLETAFFYLRRYYDCALVTIVIVLAVVVMVAMMLPGMLAIPLATALIMPTNPSMMFPPKPGYPKPFVAVVPIAWAFVIRPITHIDRDPDRHGAWPDKHANGQDSHRKNRKFLFHIVTDDSHKPDAAALILI